MTTTQIVVIVGGLVLGYAFVGAMFGKPRQSGDKPAPNANPNWSEAAESRHRAEPPPSPASWREVLGVGRDASLDDVRLAYRRLIAQYHPDKTSQLGAELRQLAEQKTVAINDAYSRALREFDARGA